MRTSRQVRKSQRANSHAVSVFSDESAFEPSPISAEPTQPVVQVGVAIVGHTLLLHEIEFVVDKLDGCRQSSPYLKEAEATIELEGPQLPRFGRAE